MIRIYSVLVLLLFSVSSAATELEISLPAPTWEFDAASPPLREREAALAPEEHEIAALLRPLIRNGQYRDAIQLLEAEDSSSFSPAMHFLQAQLYLSVDDLEKAEAAYQATLARMPDFTRAHRGLGIVYMSRGEPDDARQHITRAIALGANDAQIYGQLSYINLESGNPWSAISGYRQAMFLEPENRQWQQGLLYALIAARDFVAARALLEQLLTEHRDDSSLWLQHSNLALNTGDDAAAIASLEVALRLGETTPANILAAARLHLQSGSMERGIQLLENSLQGNNEPAPEALLQSLGWLIRQQEWQFSERLDTLLQKHRSIFNHSEESQFLAWSSELQLHQGNQEKAIALLDEAIALNPANGDALLQLAGLLEAANPARADSLYVRAGSLPEYRQRARLSQAQLAVDLGEYSKALSLLQEIRNTDPGLRHLNEHIASLQRIIALQQANTP